VVTTATVRNPAFRRAKSFLIRRLLRPLRSKAARYFRRRLLDRGFDGTEGAAAGRALFLAPHPDDEAIGCGALIARKAAAGTEVVIVISTDGRHSERADEIGPEELARVRRIEAVDAATAMGLEADAVRFLDFEDGTLEVNRGPLREALVAIEAEMRPDEIFAPHADQHPDHRVLNEVARTTFAGTSNARFYEYPIRYWGRVPWVVRPPGKLQSMLGLIVDPIREWRRPPAMLVSTKGFEDQKFAALTAYDGEMKSVGYLVYEFAAIGWEPFFPITR